MDSIFQVISNSRADFPEFERKILSVTIFAQLKEFLCKHCLEHERVVVKYS